MDTQNQIIATSQVKQDDSQETPPSQMQSVSHPATGTQQASQSTLQTENVEKTDEKKIEEPDNPVSPSGKEFGPTTPASVKEYIQPSQPEVTLSEEVKEAGVQPSPNTSQPALPPQQKHPQITLAKESVPVQTNPQGVIQLPMQEDRAIEVIKTNKPMESVRWLATLILEQAKKAHRLLKR